MATKDFHSRENIDRDERAEKDRESHHDTGSQYPDEAKGIAGVNVKNAHDAGDGSYGRADKRLTDDDDEAVEKPKPSY